MRVSVGAREDFYLFEGLEGLTKQNCNMIFAVPREKHVGGANHEPTSFPFLPGSGFDKEVDMGVRQKFKAMRTVFFFFSWYWSNTDTKRLQFASVRLRFKLLSHCR